MAGISPPIRCTFPASGGTGGHCAVREGAAAPTPTIGRVPRTWILTGSPENYAAAVRAVSARDASVLLGRMTAAAGARV